jgi:hypothetical protein
MCRPVPAGWVYAPHTLDAGYRFGITGTIDDTDVDVRHVALGDEAQEFPLPCRNFRPPGLLCLASHTWFTTRARHRLERIENKMDVPVQLAAKAAPSHQNEGVSARL